MRFASLLENIKGPQAGKPLSLLPWQKFVFANIFGWVERGTETRRFRSATVWVPRGNGKTTVAAPIALYLTFVEGEGGAEGYAAAVTRDQAKILFDTAKNMVSRSTKFRAAYGVEVGAHAIYQTRSASKLLAVSSDAKALDGLNVQVAILDEIGSHKTPEVYDVMLTATGKRRHPLLLSISTATGNLAGIGKSLHDYAARVLEGKQADERLFAVIWAADAEDDIWNPATWRKVNPSWGLAVQPDAIEGIAKQARNNPSQESAFKTRHLNIWVGADDALFSTSAFNACARKITISDFEGREAHIGCDLSSKIDLTAISLCIPERQPDGSLHYTVFCRSYNNRASVDEARNAAYPNWEAEKRLIVTDGNTTDFGTIEADILDLCRRFKVLSVAYDPWNATQLAQRLAAEGVPVVEYRQNTGTLSEPTKEFDAAMRSGRLHHDGDPILGWCISNVVGQYDARANVYPKKPRNEQKIDTALATIMSVGRAMLAEPEEESPYEHRGLVLL
nr:terminase TerL endonuclease subunit [Roseicella sp. DB1501]